MDNIDAILEKVICIHDVAEELVIDYKTVLAQLKKLGTQKSYIFKCLMSSLKKLLSFDSN